MLLGVEILHGFEVQQRIGRFLAEQRQTQRQNDDKSARELPFKCVRVYLAVCADLKSLSASFITRPDQRDAQHTNGKRDVSSSAPTCACSAARLVRVSARVL
jgi:hypothetical protein